MPVNFPIYYFKLSPLHPHPHFLITGITFEARAIYRLDICGKGVHRWCSVLCVILYWGQILSSALLIDAKTHCSWGFLNYERWLVFSLVFFFFFLIGE